MIRGDTLVEMNMNTKALPLCIELPQHFLGRQLVMPKVHLDRGAAGHLQQLVTALSKPPFQGHVV